MIKNLIYDFGKVLVDYDFDRFFNRMYADRPGDLKGFVGVLSQTDFMERCDRETVPFADLIAEYKQRFPYYAEHLQYFHDYFPDVVTGEMPGMRELLSRLKDKGYKLYGLSNWCSTVYKTMAQYDDIFSLLDGYVVSSDVQLIKPEEDIYLCLCEKYGLKPEECLFADDKPINIDGARKVGMEGVVFESAEQYKDVITSEYHIVIDN